MTRTCPDCGREYDGEFKYCRNCGALLLEGQIIEVNSIDIDGPSDDSDVISCPECGTEQASFAKFCRNCGAQLSGENNADGKTRCRHCGCELTAEAYCPDCGKPTGITVCPNCQQKTVGKDFCSVCGYRFNQNVKRCGHCGGKIDAKAKVCAHCGAEVLHKSPFIAALLSFFFPGLGQIYNRQIHKGIILIAAYIVSFILTLIFIGAILVLLIWLYGMYDGFVTSKAINEGESVEDRIF